jgi:hypothetical protein
VWHRTQVWRAGLKFSLGGGRRREHVLPLLEALGSTCLRA